MGSLSRVQLAAALIEYDNDDPYATERKFAKESAIMSSVRSEQTRPRKTSQTPAKPVRRDWTQERELEKKEQEDEDERHRAEQPSPVGQDFRRSSSPYLQDISKPAPLAILIPLARPSSPPSASAQRSPSPPATPRQVVVSQPKLVKPKAGKSQRNVSISGVLADMMDTKNDENTTPAPPKAHVPVPPHSTQPLNSSSLLDPIPMTIPLQPPPSIPRASSSNSLSSKSTSIYTAAPVNVFNVPSFDPRLTSTRPVPPPKRRLSAFLNSSKPKSPSPLAPQPLAPSAEPIRPLSETLRQSIASLPRSLGGEGPSARSFGQRGRTASMGDWESLVLAHGGDDATGEFGGYAQRVREAWETPAQAEQKQETSRESQTEVPGADDDGTVEFEGVYGVRASAPSPPTRAELAPLIVLPPLEQRSEVEELRLQEESYSHGEHATPESSWGGLSYDDEGSRRPSSGFSFLDRVPLEDGADLDLPPMFSNDETGSNTPRSTAGDYNDRAIPFPASNNSRPLSPATPATPFRGLDLELGDDDRRDHGSAGGRTTPGGSFWDEIGRSTPDLLSKDDGRDSIEGLSRQSFRTSQFKEVSDRNDEDDEEELEEERWVPPPTKGRASRFDPKSQSISSRMTPVQGGSDFGDNEDQRRQSIEQQADDVGRRLPGKRGKPTKPRPTSLAHFNQTRRLSTTPTSSIFLPPVLVMPGPLDPSAAGPSRSRSNSVSGRAGFVEMDSKPLPASFTSRPPHVHSTSSSSFVTAAASPALPTKRLSLAQKTFRASLVVDGKRGNEFMGGALEEGERGWELDEDAGLESVLEGPGARGEGDYRGPGSLYGRSLMEVLEERKIAMKSKQKAFAGDSRPAMFTRSRSTNSFQDQRPMSIAGSVHLNPTLPGASGLSPGSDFQELLQENPARPNTLLNPNDGRPGMSKTRNSVFGIDQLWEKEARQREVEDRAEAEWAAKRQEEERLKVALEEEKKRAKLEKTLGKKAAKKSLLLLSGASSLQLAPVSPGQVAAATPLPSSPSDNRISSLPPALALQETSPSRPLSRMLRLPGDDDSDSDWEAREEERGEDDLGVGGQARPRPKKGRSSGAAPAGEERRKSGGLGIGTWFASSDEEEDGDGTPRRRRPNANTKTAPPPPNDSSDTSSDDEVPLAAQYNLSSSRRTIGGSSFVTKPASPSDSEEERPLAQIKRERELTNASAVFYDDDDEEDDRPLGLRHQQQPNEDDDLPLGLTQAQHLQQIYLAQQQQMATMQHQMAMQHQFQVRQSMMMGMGIGGMGMQQMQPPGGGPRAEERVDRWRRGVEGTGR